MAKRGRKHGKLKVMGAHLGAKHHKGHKRGRKHGGKKRR